MFQTCERVVHILLKEEEGMGCVGKRQASIRQEGWKGRRAREQAIDGAVSVPQQVAATLERREYDAKNVGAKCKQKTGSKQNFPDTLPPQPFATHLVTLFLTR